MLVTEDNDAIRVRVYNDYRLSSLADSAERQQLMSGDAQQRHTCRSCHA